LFLFSNFWIILVLTSRKEEPEKKQGKREKPGKREKLK